MTSSRVQAFASLVGMKREDHLAAIRECRAILAAGLRGDYVPPPDEPVDRPVEERLPYRD